MSDIPEKEDVAVEIEPLERGKPKTEKETGIIYLSRIPSYMNVKTIRQIFTQYGEIGRLFLQPNEKTAKKKNREFTEGWVEFVDKKVAKSVARSLNNQQIGGKRRNPWYDEIWNIRYLTKFKWSHLNERLAYEREVHKQRLRTEVAQAKRETSFYIQNVEKRQLQKRLEKKGRELDSVKGEWEFKQKETEDEILKKKQLDKSSNKKRKSDGSHGGESKKSKSDKLTGPNAKHKAASDKSFLKNIFSGGLGAESDDS